MKAGIIGLARARILEREAKASIKAPTLEKVKIVRKVQKKVEKVIENVKKKVIKKTEKKTKKK